MDSLSFLKGLGIEPVKKVKPIMVRVDRKSLPGAPQNEKGGIPVYSEQVWQTIGYVEEIGDSGDPEPKKEDCEKEFTCVFFCPAPRMPHLS